MPHDCPVILPARIHDGTVLLIFDGKRAARRQIKFQKIKDSRMFPEFLAAEVRF